VALEALRAVQQTHSQLMHDAEVGTWRYDPDTDSFRFSSELSLGTRNLTTPCQHLCWPRFSIPTT